MTGISRLIVAAAIAATPPQRPNRDKETVGRVLAVTADLFETAPETILGPCRKRQSIEARHVAIAVLRGQTDLSYPEIAVLFDRKQETCRSAVETVMEAPWRLAWCAAVVAELSTPNPGSSPTEPSCDPQDQPEKVGG